MAAIGPGTASAGGQNGKPAAPRMRFKVLLLGPHGVGKTSLARRLAQDPAQHSAHQQAGIDFYTRTVALRDSAYVTLQIWDVDSEQLSQGMLHSCLFGSQAVLLVYDVSDAASLATMGGLLESVRQYFAGDGAGVLPYLALVGNKSDLPPAVTRADHDAIAALSAAWSSGCMHSIFTDAASGEGCAAAAAQLASDLAGIPLGQEEEAHLRTAGPPPLPHGFQVPASSASPALLTPAPPLVAWNGAGSTSASRAAGATPHFGFAPAPTSGNGAAGGASSRGPSPSPGGTPLLVVKGKANAFGQSYAMQPSSNIDFDLESATAHEAEAAPPIAPPIAAVAASAGGSGLVAVGRGRGGLSRWCCCCRPLAAS